MQRRRIRGQQPGSFRHVIGAAVQGGSTTVVRTIVGATLEPCGRGQHQLTLHACSMLAEGLVVLKPGNTGLHALSPEGQIHYPRTIVPDFETGFGLVMLESVVEVASDGQRAVVGRPIRLLAREVPWQTLRDFHDCPPVHRTGGVEEIAYAMREDLDEIFNRGQAIEMAPGGEFHSPSGSHFRVDEELEHRLQEFASEHQLVLN